MATAARKLRSDAGSQQGDGPKQDHVFRDFRGINTQAARQAIQPGEFAWIENIMPIGHGNLKILPARSDALQSVASGVCYYLNDYNINDLNYTFMACSDGTAYQVALASPYTRTTIGSGFSASGLEIAQWKNERILIVDPVHGLYSWDGTTLTSAGELLLATVTAGGSYTAIPTWTVAGGGGTGGAVSSVMALAGAQTITAAGTGYVVGDVLTLVDGTFTVVGKLRVTTVGGGGTVTAVSILQAGSYTVLGTAPLATTGAGNNDCTITPAYEVISLTVTNPGDFYDTAPVLTASAGAATATAVLLQGPDNPEHIATFSDIVWISSGRTLSNSVQDTYYDFSGTGSGTLIVADETLHSSITQLLAANGFLYFTGTDSINAIGDVQINTLGDTVFSNVNLSATVGTDEGASVVSYFRSVWLANRSGIYSVVGSTPIKASDALDGIWENVDFTQPISAGVMFLQKILCVAFLFQYNDPALGITRPLIAVYFNKKWFVTSQGSDVDFITTGIEAGSALYSTDGTSLYKLFADDATNVDWSFSTAYWDMKDVVRGKQITKFGFEATIVESVGTINVLIETLSSTAPYTSSESYDVAATSAVIWINNLDETVSWINNSTDEVAWIGTGYFMDMEDGDEFGKYVGMTLSSSDILGSLSSTMLEYTFRERW